MSRRRTLRSSILVIACSLALAAAAPATASAVWAGGVLRVSVPASRVDGHGVYGTAVVAAQRAYPAWHGVRHVVIASGQTAGLSDAAVASSLCWAYDAPLLLVSSKSAPAVTRAALAAIVSANPSVTVHVVGSSSTIEGACLSQIRASVGSATVEQPWKAAGHYSLALFVARRVRDVAAQKGSVIPSVALVANGSDPARLWDAAAASAISRHTGIPIFLLARDAAPGSTVVALAAAGSPRVIVVGDTAGVSAAVYASLHASERWWGTTRYGTAASVADRAAAAGFSEVATFGIAATIPDAIVGAELVGSRGGVLLYSGRERLQRTTWSFLAQRSLLTTSAYVIGGDSIAASQLAELRGAAAKPWFASGAPGKYVAKRFRVTGWVGGNTTTVSLFVCGQKVRTAAVTPWGTFNFTSVTMPVSKGVVWVVASNPDRRTGGSGRVVKRLKYPAATCIVIDKSDFKLYWVRRNQLVKAYPIAIGRASLETPAPAQWKILAKYHTSPDSVYGPRKMRLFRLRGGRFVFSAYGIHGTNQPWVIGTKASHGCIRMYNRDVRELFPQVPMGTLVFTRP